MTEAKHTPGPWVFNDDLGTIEAESGMVADVNGSGFSIKEDERNGALIAAAPDLLEALYRLKSEAEADGMDKRAGWDCWVSLANAAIAKAEGRTDA